eukprot:1918029-Rhodomonas_salina.2
MMMIGEFAGVAQLAMMECDSADATEEDEPLVAMGGCYDGDAMTMKLDQMDGVAIVLGAGDATLMMMMMIKKMDDEVPVFELQYALVMRGCHDVALMQSLMMRVGLMEMVCDDAALMMR